MKLLPQTRRGRMAVLGGTALSVLAVSATVASAAGDFGVFRDSALANKSKTLFGVTAGIPASSTLSVDLATATANPLSLVTLAPGLTARVVTSGVAGANIDQMALWPSTSKPTTIIACNEQDPTLPGLQRIDIATGAVTTIVTGTAACDGVRLTAWGTIMFSEENGGGNITGGATYELIDPMNTTGVTVDRTTGLFSGGTGAANLVRRDSLGRQSFEGHGLFANGVMYYGDENRPASGVAGGAYFKFVPARPWISGTITQLSDSPFASGKIFGLRLGKRGNVDYGQGTQTGLGNWIPVCDDATATPCANADLRLASATLNLTGYYRPEDLEVDPAALVSGGVAKVCGNNTGNEVTDHNWGETICITDGTLRDATAGISTPEVQYLVVGSNDMSMTDNIAYQPGRGNWLIHEDGDVSTPGGSGRNNDLWSCLPDGADGDTLSDGCLRVGTLNDSGTAAHVEGAEWTGGIFDATGKRFFVSIQHNITDKGVILEITGWK